MDPLHLPRRAEAPARTPDVEARRYVTTHAARPEDACDPDGGAVSALTGEPAPGNFRCTLLAGHDGPHLMRRDLANRWHGVRRTW